MGLKKQIPGLQIEDSGLKDLKSWSQHSKKQPFQATASLGISDA